MNFKGKMPSGLSFEVGEMKGKHQKMLSQYFAKKQMNEGLNAVLADVLISLGDKKNITVADVKHLLICDRNFALVKARAVAMDNDPFSFNYEYKGSTGLPTQTELVYDFEVSGEFPVTTVKVLNDEDKLVDANFENGYTDKDKIVEFTLPKSKKIVRFRMLDGKGEENGSLIKKSDRSSHTPLIMRNVSEVTKTKDGEELNLILDLDDLGMKDIEAIRQKIYDFEGRVGTEIKFDDPSEERDFITIDALGQPAFFFPSEKL